GPARRVRDRLVGRLVGVAGEPGTASGRGAAGSRGRYSDSATSRAASDSSTRSWIDGTSRSSWRKARCSITSTRTGDVVTMVAERGAFMIRAISPNQPPGPSSAILRPRRVILTVPSTSTKNSRPGTPSLMRVRPASRSSSSASDPICASCRFEQARNSSTRESSSSFTFLRSGIVARPYTPHGAGGSALRDAGRGARNERPQHLVPDRGHVLEQAAERVSLHDEQPHGLGGGHARRARRVREQRDLAEEVAARQGAQLAAAPAHVDAALDEDAELAAAGPLAHQLGARGEVQLVGDRRDPPELALRASREQRHPGHELDLGVPAQAHEAMLDARSVSRRLHFVDACAYRVSSTTGLTRRSTCGRGRAIGGGSNMRRGSVVAVAVIAVCAVALFAGGGSATLPHVTPVLNTSSPCPPTEGRLYCVTATTYTNLSRQGGVEVDVQLQSYDRNTLTHPALKLHYGGCTATGTQAAPCLSDVSRDPTATTHAQLTYASFSSDPPSGATCGA